MLHPPRCSCYPCANFTQARTRYIPRYTLAMGSWSWLTLMPADPWGGGVPEVHWWAMRDRGRMAFPFTRPACQGWSGSGGSTSDLKPCQGCPPKGECEGGGTTSGLPGCPLKGENKKGCKKAFPLARTPGTWAGDMAQPHWAHPLLHLSAYRQFLYAGWPTQCHSCFIRR